MLLLSAPLDFSKTARFEGKLFVTGLSLEGPCFWFEEDAFIESSAELHFADCHNEEEDEEEDADGGAIYVGGNLTVIGNLSIHNCSADYGGSLAWSICEGFLLVDDGESVLVSQVV